MSAAVLFYGYNLGAPDDSGWAIQGEENFDQPWFDDAVDFERDYADAMRGHLLVKSGLVELKDFTTFDAEEKVAARYGVEVVSYGHSNTRFYGLALTGTVDRADDWSPKHVAPTASGDATRLYKALELLGMQPTQVNPSWILAPDEH